MLLNGTFAATTLDRESIPQARLDVVDRVRTNLFPWAGQFSPQFVEEILDAYAPSVGGVALDPFVGSGTTLVEAARRGLAAHGSELNPAALILARVYQIVNLDAAGREVVLRRLGNLLSDEIGPPDGPLFHYPTSGPADRDSLEATLVRLWRNSTPGPIQILTAALIVLCDFHQKHLDAGTIHRAWLRLKRIVRALPESTQPVAVHHADARVLPIETGSIDLVLTSPPYINVHNYHQKFRRSVEALKWNVLGLARSEIGANRQNRANRFLTVIQYSLDMALALREMARAAKPGSRLILVLGRESLVRGVRFYNGELVTELATGCVGMRLERRQERAFRNRYGNRIYEDILHFLAPNEVPDEDSSLTTARCVAKQALGAARPLTPATERPGIEHALLRTDVVAPSPMPLLADLWNRTS